MMVKMKMKLENMVLSQATLSLNSKKPKKESSQKLFLLEMSIKSLLTFILKSQEHS